MLIDHFHRKYKLLFDYCAGSVAGFTQVLVAAATKRTYQRIINCPAYPVPARTQESEPPLMALLDAMRSERGRLAELFAALYARTRPIVYRKAHGQFFTDPAMARKAIDYANITPADDVLDAGAGSCVFGEKLLASKAAARSYTGVENDPVLALAGAHVLEADSAPTLYRVWYTNFLTVRAASFTRLAIPLPTVFLANPPFLRSSKLIGRARISAILQELTHIELPSSSGAANFFLLKAAAIAEETKAGSSRLVFLSPRESVGSRAAIILRERLASTLGWHAECLPLPSRQSGVDSHRSNAAAVVFVFRRRRHGITTRAPEVQGRHLSIVARVKRGISTGCNEFFVLSDAAVAEAQLPAAYLTRVLPTRIPLRGVAFGPEEWQMLRAGGAAVWLLTLPPWDINEFEAPVREYLKSGVRRAIDTSVTAKRLKRWYSLPLPSEPAHFFLTYIFRGTPRFLANTAGVAHLTNILGCRLNRPLPDTMSLEDAAKLLSTEAEKWVGGGLIQRTYRDNLMKFEPREVEALPISDVVAETLIGTPLRDEPRNALLF